MQAEIQRIVSILCTRANVVAVLVPVIAARKLVDELYPEVEEMAATGVDMIDTARQVRISRRREERAKYMSVVEVGGFVGRIFGRPMIVAEDVVLCGLTREELEEVAGRFGLDAGEVLEGG